ncbi:MAG: YggS family pyridoxal phosphate-dependent enzyme [Bacteroidaceae bacterium]|nr:YggS family pyridoxal phosphate-dependent enzyme [Bacteroidaceae bacterium]
MIGDVLDRLREELPQGVDVVAVSKYFPADSIREAYAAGQRMFGESRVQELLVKRNELPDDIQWHFIGHLQTNKVRLIAPFVSLIHAVDSEHLLEEISRQGERCGRVIPCLLQLHVAQEETKFGFTPGECIAMLEKGEWRLMTGAQIAGVMCMASNTDDERQIEAEFGLVRKTFETIRLRFFADNDAFRHCSWGMSGDYPIAVRTGATLVRIGSMIFRA